MHENTNNRSNQRFFVIRHLFTVPVEKESLEDWAKIAIDISKVALVAISAVLYGDTPIIQKLVNVIILIVIVYFMLFFARNIRILINRKKSEEA